MLFIMGSSNTKAINKEKNHSKSTKKSSKNSQISTVKRRNSAPIPTVTEERSYTVGDKKFDRLTLKHNGLNETHSADAHGKRHHHGKRKKFALKSSTTTDSGGTRRSEPLLQHSIKEPARRQSIKPSKSMQNGLHRFSLDSENDLDDFAAPPPPRRGGVKQFNGAGGKTLNQPSTSTLPSLRGMQNGVRGPPQQQHRSLPPNAGAKRAPGPGAGAAKPTGANIVPAAKGAPVGTITECIAKMRREEWEDKVAGINGIISISQSNPRSVESDLHLVTSELIREARNLRSTVSRQALIALGTLPLDLPKGCLDSELEPLTKVLLDKTGDVSSGFIREDALKALENLVDSTKSEGKLISALGQGAKAKNVTIRSASAQAMCRLAANVGGERALNSKEMCDKLLPLGVQFSRDAQPAPRQNGRMMLQTLQAANPQLFEKQLKRLCTDADVRHIYSVLNK